MSQINGGRLQVPRVFLVMAVIVAALTLFLGFDSPLRVVRFQPSQVQKLNEGWVYETTRGAVKCNAPARVDSGLENVVFTNYIPEDIKDGWSLYFETMYQAVEVNIGGTRIYEYGMEHKPSIGKMLGNTAVLLTLPEGSQGRKVEITLKSPFHQGKAYLSSVWAGEQGSIFLNVLSRELGKIIFIIFMYFTAAAILLFHYGLQKRGRLKISGSWYMSAFIFMLATWMVTDSHMVQFFTSRVEAVTALSFSTFMLMPVPLFMTLGILAGSRRTKKLLDCFGAGFLAIYGAALLLYLSETVDFFYTVRATHLLLVAGIIMGVGRFWRDVREQKTFHQKVLMTAVVCLAVCGGLALIIFYLKPDYDRTRIFQYGVLMFILLMLWAIGRRVMAIAEENLHTAYYRDMAYRDPLTRLYNRNGLKAHVERAFEGAERRKRDIGLLMMDVDYFKHYNDTYGHLTGDLCLAAISRVLSETLRKKNDGACRYGGEEFLVFLYGTDLKGAVRAGERIRRIVEEMELVTEDGALPAKVTISIGAVGGKAASWEEVEQLAGQADRQLYQAKEGGRNRVSYSKEGINE